jgi:SOS-response transcriptional repressor LexA
MSSVADRIKQFRTRACMTQGKLAELCGWSQSRIGNYESSRRAPPLSEARIIARVLGVTLEELVSENPLSSPKKVSYDYPVVSLTDVEGMLAGNPIPTHTQTEVSHYCTIGQAYWLPITEDTLNSATGLSLCAGSLLLIDTQAKFGSGSIVLAQLPGSRGLTIRKLVKDAGDSYLMALNPAYAIISQEGEFDVLGVVVESKLIF